ncbi:helix-turn-helix transcriptional regulator [Quadrisphaera sp. KR29]|uniref:helix-turn-helix transcriptional regulator n=1 Tax=Quadrisphaera sp. KR29 TaxID=3461391 RepID=UPI004043A525
MPVEVFEFSTRRPEVAQSVLSEAYATEGPLRFTGVQDGFRCDLRSASAEQLGASRLRLAASMVGEVAPVDHLLVSTGVHGDCHYAVGRDEHHLLPAGVFRHPNGTAVSARYSGIGITALSLPMAVVERVAAERCGTAAADLRFDGVEPVSQAAQRSWLQLGRYVDSQLTSAASAVSSPLVAAALAELVAATALVTFANTTMSQHHQPGPGHVAPAVVRRAVAFIEANASLPISTSDVARAAGVGPRALQLAFARHVGVTPMAHLRRVRLQAAHRELQAADPTAGDTVAAVALRWGFARPDRFAAVYRAAYGVTPSHTLRT